MHSNSFGRTVAGALLVFIFIVFIIAPAFAQDADTTISLTGFLDPIRPLLMEMVGLLVAAVIGWITMRLNRSLGMTIEARHREALQSALMNGAFYGLNQLDKAASSVTFDTHNKMVAEGVRYVQKSVPDAIKFFGLTPERLRELLEAKIPAIEQDAKPDA